MGAPWGSARTSELLAMKHRHEGIEAFFVLSGQVEVLSDERRPQRTSSLAALLEGSRFRVWQFYQVAAGGSRERLPASQFYRVS